MHVFDHEKLDVYVASIEFVALAEDIVEHLPRGRGHLADRRVLRQLLLRIVAVLVQMVRRAGESGSGTGTGSISARK